MHVYLINNMCKKCTAIHKLYFMTDDKKKNTKTRLVIARFFLCFFAICTILFYVKSFHLRKIIPISFGILHFTTFYYASDTYEALLRTCCHFREKMCQLLAMDHCEYFYLKKKEKWTNLFRFWDQSIHKIYFLIRCFNVNTY